MRAIAAVTLLLLSSATISKDYDRNLYGRWIDFDKDCQNTRQEVLIAESLAPVTLDTKKCKVLTGLWYDPFTGKEFTSPTKLDIDHFVPLKEVHLSGGGNWSSDKRKEYANDIDYPYTLIAVSLSANRSKGARDPANWMPPNKSFHCDYIRTWVAIKARWDLSIDKKEQAKIDEVLNTCN